MRYEDASQISTDVTARDDTDHLAGNDFGPATGNIITGSGTVSGATGTDSGGSITAIVGAGGSDNSFDGNGMLEVAGQYGTLTIDAQGNYTYVRAPGSPEGVSDTFTYTLANEAGATDTAQLVIAIGNPPILQAQGTQTIQTNDGVVVLPAGVELSDVRVVGRDLVITLPDGSTMVIPDGAVFVPQLVVNGVEVPASNLAALLIDSEPRPAAGDQAAQQSSGGNFGLPPGPLDPGVPLGDLLPPTELDYTPPEVDELFDAFDNDPPVISPSSVNVSDEGVSTVDVPIPDNAGSPDTTNLRIVNGHINIVDPDGDAVTITLGEPTNALTSQGDPIDWSVSADGHTVIGTAGGIEVIRIVIENDGDYTVTQSRPIDHPNTSIEDGVSFGIPVFATDGEDFAVPGTITVTIEDDSPVVDSVTVRGGITLDESSADPRTPEGFPISGSTDGAIIVNSEGGFGADGPAADDATVYGLGLTGGVSSLASGIQTAIGNHAITLVQVSSTLIEGRYNGAQVAFTVEMNGDGSVTLTQNVPLEHLVDGPPGPDHDDTLDLGGLVNATVTLTDFDGDTATGSAPIGDSLVFRDDGPNAAANEQIPAGEVILDETREEGTDTDDGDPVASPPPGLASDTLEFADNFFAPDFGADGEGSVTYKLLLSGEDVGSGLYALEGGDTELAIDDGDGYGQGDEIVLNISADGLTITGSAGETDYFTITINPNSGVVTFTQLNPIWHPIIGDFDDEVTLTTDALNDIQVQQTVTDSDGDFDSAAVGVGQGVFKIQDDGPDPYDPCPEPVLSVNDPDSEPFTGDLNLPDAGEDQPPAVTFGVETGDRVEDTEGNPITSDDQEIFYVVNGNVLEAHAGDTGGPLVFTITLNLEDGTFTYDQIGPIGSGGTTTFDDLTSTSAGNVEFRGVGADDPATTIDLLLSAEKDGADETVNTDSDSIGSANQSMDAGETVRIDFVTDLTSGAATPSQFGYTGHVSSSTFLGLIPQVQGSQAETTALTVWALDSSNTQAAEPDRDPAGGFSDSTITAITDVTVKDYLTGNTHTEAVAFTDGTTFVALDFGISVRVNADGSVTFSGIQQGDSYGFTTGGGDFNAVAVQAEPAGTGGSTQDSFDLGVFSIGVANEFEPVDLEVPVVLTDADGDAVECHIDIHIGEPLVVADVTVTVNEAGLDLVGSNPLSDSEMQSGNLTPSGGTGPYTFTLQGSPVGDFGTLELLPDGSFTYTLTKPFDTDPSVDDGANPELGKDSFDVLITDFLGATHTATITVNIIDDVPTAVEDTDTVADGGPLVATGNVLTDNDPGDLGDTDDGADTIGADQVGEVVTEVQFGATTVAAGTAIAGTYGSLTLNANGSYTYTLNPADADYGDILALGAGEFETEVFTYTMIDGDGDSSTTTLTIKITGLNDLPTGVAGAAVVSEEGLDGGIPDGTPAGDDTNFASDTDGDLNFVDPDGDAVTYALGTPVGSFADADGNPISWVVSPDGHTLTGSSSAGPVITVTINDAGEFDVNLLLPMDHGADGNIESEFNIVVPVTVSDGTGTVPTTITVQVEDDKPVVTGSTQTPPPLLEVDDTTLGTNDTASFAAQFSVLFGGDGPKDPADEVDYALGINAGATGIFDTATGQQVQLELDGSGVVHGFVMVGLVKTDVFTVSVNDDGVVTLDQLRAVVHEDALGDPSDAPETLASANLITLTATAVDSDDDSDSHTINIGTQLRFADDHPFIDVTATDSAGNKVLTQDADTIGAGVQDVATSTVAFNGAFAIATANPGNDGPSAINPGAQGNYALSLAPGYVEGTATTMMSGGVAIRLYIDGGVITGSTAADEGSISAANTIFTISVSNAVGDEGEVTLTQYQQIDHPVEGVTTAPFADQELLLPNNLVRLTFEATLEDGDGDVDSDSAFIDLGGNIGFQDHGPTATNDVDAIAAGFFGTATGNVMTGVEGGNVVEDANPSDGSADNVGADTPGRISQVSFTSDGGGAPVVQAIAPGGSTVIAGDYGVLTLYSNGDYSYDRNDGSAGGVNDVFTYTLRDFDGDTVTATLTINIAVNPPVATTGEAAVDDDGLGGANPAGTNDINANTFPTVDDLDGPASSEASFTGQLGVTGGDGDIDFNLIAPAGQVAIGQEMVTFAYAAGVLTATIADSPSDPSRVGDPLFTVTLNEDTGQYTVNLLENVLHGNDASNDEDGSELQVQIQYQVTDASANNSALPGVLTITFNDDMPSATPVLSTVGAAVVDESLPVEAATIDTLTVVKGDDPAFSGGLAIGKGSTAGSVLTANAVFGADGAATAGSLTYALTVINAASGLETTEGDPINLELLANGVVVGVVDGGDFDGQAAFAIQINSSTGAITVEQYLSLLHPTNPDANEDISMALDTLGATVTVTDADGDTVTSSSVDISTKIDFFDDGPTLGAVEDGTANNDPNAVHSFGTLNFTSGADDPGAALLITADVAGIKSGGKTLVTNQDGNVLTAYQSFDGTGPYEPGEDTVVVFTLTINPADDTWEFDLVTPLDPTVTDTPIGGSSSFGAGPSVQGFVLEDAGGTDLALVTGYNTNGTFNFNTWHTTGVLSSSTISAGGVNGSTSGWGVDDNNFDDPNELFFFDFGAQALANPDGDPAPPGPDDADYQPPAGVTLPNISVATFDFINFVPGDDIAFVVHYTDGTFTSGFIPAVNLDGSSNAAATNWTHTATAGKFIADIQFFSGANADGTAQNLSPGKVDLVSVGVQTSSLNVDIDFTVSMQDSDGDPTGSDSFTINIQPTNTPSEASAALAFSTMMESREAFNGDDSSSFSLLGSNETQQVEKTAANSNNVVLAAAIGAAGFAANGAAAHTPRFDVGDHYATNAVVGREAFMDFNTSEVSGGRFADLTAFLDGGFEFGAMPLASTSHQAITASHIGELTTAFSLGGGPNALLEATDFGAMLQMPAPAMGMDVAMVSADALMPQGSGVTAQSPGGIEQILADALQGGGSAPDIDALLNALPGGGLGGNAGLQNLATQAGDSVPAWDMGHGGVFTFDVASIITSEAMVLHHDAVQPVANG